MDVSMTFRGGQIEKPTLGRILIVRVYSNGIPTGEDGPAIVTATSDDSARRAVHVRLLFGIYNQDRNAYHLSVLGDLNPSQLRGLIYFWEWPPRVLPTFYE